MKTHVGLTLLLLLFILACEKKDESGPDDPSGGYIDSFVSLTAGKDTLLPGESTTIVARVKGDCVNYAWEATQGDILGSGSVITYIAQLCDCGKSRISCSASAGNYNMSRDLIIYILDE